MKSNAEILTTPSSKFVPTLIHPEVASEEERPAKLSSLESLQIALAFVVGCALTLLTMLM